MRVRWLVVVPVALAALSWPTRARADAGAECLARLDELGVAYRTVKRRGIDTGVRIEGAVGGIEYEAYNGDPLVLDCSLVYSLAVAGRYLVTAGIYKVTYSSAYQRRTVRGTRRLSRHSFGLAIDVHTFHTDARGSLTVRDDYEQGLGDHVDCIGQPLTAAGVLLKQLECQLERSTLFRIVLDPDYDAGHYNHFHVEALPWTEREDLAIDWTAVVARPPVTPRLFALLRRVPRAVGAWCQTSRRGSANASAWAALLAGVPAHLTQ